MAKNVLNQISSYDSLNAAWKKLWNKTRTASRNTYGVDGQSLNDFSKDVSANLLSISRRLKKGNYTFSTLRPFFVVKPSGKIRVICIPTTSDRVVQGALLDFLSSKYTERFKNDISYGFLKGRDVKSAVLEAAKLRTGNNWVFKTDIKSFFDQISRQELKEKIRKIVKEKSIHELLTQIVDCEIEHKTKSEAEKISAQGIEVGKGVRQGMPLSPLFSNIVLERFDKAVSCNKYSAVRYADDLIFFAKDKNSCLKTEEFCSKQLAIEGLEIPHSSEAKSKSVVYSPSQPAEFLGVAICMHGGKYQIRLMPVQIKSIVESFNVLANVSELLARKITIGRLLPHLNARKSGYIHAYDLCSNILELENSLNDIEQKVLKKIYKQDLGINLQTISKEVRTFLGLG